MSKNFFENFSVNNLKHNLYFVLCGLVLLTSQTPITKTNIVALIISLIALLIIASLVSPSELLKPVKKASLSIKIFSCLTALGVSIQTDFFLVEKIYRFGKILVPYLLYVRIAAAFASFIFAYVCVIYFWDKFIALIKSRKLFNGLTRGEVIFYCVIFAASIYFCTNIFMRSNAFYASGHLFDIIYYSDSDSILVDNCFMRIFHTENDIRQPLFAIFAIPFMGVPYLLSRVAAILFGQENFFRALFMNYVQIAMLLAGVIMLTKTMRLKSLYRGIFASLFCCSYIYLLFILMIEQYIIAFFWLSFAVYIACEKDVSESDSLALYGAGATLTTSFVITPFYVGGYYVQY